AREYISGIKKFDYVKFKINLIEDLVPNKSAILTIKCVVDGQDIEGMLFQDRLFFRWKIENRGSLGNDDWQILSDQLVEGVRVAGNGNSFRRVPSKEVGIDYKHARDPKLNKNNPDVHLKFAVIEHAAGGVSAVDIDADGNTDLFFADGIRSRLFRNTTPAGSSNVVFEDITNESGLDGIDQACSAMFGDFDNDGDKDLFVSRYFAPCKFYRNDGKGIFVDATTQVALDLVAPCVSSCLLDYDGDGFLDVYVGVNGDAFHDAPDIPFYSTNGQPNRLYRNLAGKRFVDVTAESGTGNSGWTLAVTSGDYNHDGRPDLAVANDFGRKVLYQNNGDGTFTDRAKEAGVLDFSGGMGIAFGDLNGDDLPDLMTSNIESGQRYFGEEITLWQFMRNEIRSGWIWHDLPVYRELYGLLGNKWRDLGKQIGEGNSVFCNLGNGKFQEWKNSHTNRAGWAWSVNPFDFDNDGDMDIYVANGWVSGKRKDDL
ncbi:MAG: VCBS repeat-containing protein, partial [Pirellula sp.]